MPAIPSTIHAILSKVAFSFKIKAEKSITKIGFELISIAAVEAFPILIDNCNAPMLINIFNTPNTKKNNQSFLCSFSFLATTKGNNVKPPMKNLMNVSCKGFIIPFKVLVTTSKVLKMIIVIAKSK